MEKECCNLKVTETEDGFRVEVKGEGVKEMAAACLNNCCNAETGGKGFRFCCGSDK